MKLSAFILPSSETVTRKEHHVKQVTNTLKRLNREEEKS